MTRSRIKASCHRRRTAPSSICAPPGSGSSSSPAARSLGGGLRVDLPIDAAVAENGAVAALPGGRRIYFDDEATRAEGARRKAAAIAEVRAELPSVKAAGDQALREIDLAFDIAETVRLDESVVARLAEILRGAVWR